MRNISPVPARAARRPVTDLSLQVLDFSDEKVAAPAEVAA